MALKYYPSSRVQTGLNTTGNLFSLNGKPYTGPYYLTYDGKAFSGVNPAFGNNELLTPIGETGVSSRISTRLGRMRGVAANRAINNAFQAPVSQSAPTLKQITSYYPEPTSTDYSRGYFTRYFAKKVNIKGYIIEISNEDWTKIRNNQDETFEDYQIMDMFWQLTGPKEDQRISQYQIEAGVYTTNKRITENEARSFPGLIEFIGGEYTKFARITT